MQEIRKVGNSELKKLLRSHVLYNQNSPIKSSMHIIGEADSGKTTAVEEICKELGYLYIKLNLATMNDPYDLNGNPVVQVELRQKKENNKYDTFYANESVASTYVNENTVLTGRQRTSYVLPEKLQKMTSSTKVVLLLDDYNRGNPFLVKAVMELVNTGSYSAWEGYIPEDFQVILTSNFDNGEYDVTSTDKAENSRMATVELVWSIEDYIVYKLSEDILRPIREYVIANKESFSNLVFRRRFEHVLMAYKLYKGDVLSFNNFYDRIVTECPAIATTLTNYLQSNDLLSMRELLDSEDVEETFVKTFTSKSKKVNNPKISQFISNFFYILEAEIYNKVQNFTKEDFETLFRLCNKYLSKDLLYTINNRLVKLHSKSASDSKFTDKNHYLFSMYFDIDNYDSNDELNVLIDNINSY